MYINYLLIYYYYQLPLRDELGNNNSILCRYSNFKNYLSQQTSGIKNEESA